MLDKMKYVNSINQEVEFGSDGIIINTNDVRDFVWTYTSKYNRLANFYKSISQKALPVMIYGENKVDIANRMFEILDYDTVNQQKGKLYVGDYYIQGYFIGSNKMDYTGHVYKLKLIFVTDNAFWIKETTTKFNISTSKYDVSGKNLDYEHDYPYDYTTRLNATQINNTNYVDSDFRIVIYGPVSEPVINIGSSMYKVNVRVKEKEYLTIDSLNKKLYITQNNGSNVSVYNNRDRSNYIFTKIPTGVQRVSWNSDFRFDITLIEQRSEPKWI